MRRAPIVTLFLLLALIPPAQAASTTSVLRSGIAINEILIDPNGTENFDTDGNGTAATEDEFMELYNLSSSAIDISGLELWDAGRGKWFAFPSSTVLPAVSYAVVVAQVQAGGALPPTSGGNLAFNADLGGGIINNIGDNVVLYDPTADTYVQFVYNGDTVDDPTSYAGFSATATRVGSVENWGADTDGVSLVRDPAGDTNVVVHNTIASTNASPGGPTSTPSTGILINEVDADTSGTDTLEFIELFDGGSGNTSLTGLVVVLYNGSSHASYAAYDLDGYSTDTNGYFVLGNAAVSGVSLTFPDNTLQNGADAVALYVADSTDFPAGTPVTTVNLLDAIVYDTNDLDDPGLLQLLNTDQPQVDETGGGDSTAHSNQRCPNGEGGQRNTSTYTQAAPTAGADNACAPPIGSCGGPATLISAIQGITDTSPLNGSTGIILEGVVVGDFQDTSINGFYVQEEDADVDADPVTSEGIFVYNTSFAVDAGDVVRLQGNVSEYDGLTEVGGVSDVLVCSAGITVTPGQISLPLPSDTYLERFEGMSITIPQTLTVTENYDLGRYGEVLLSNGRLMNPTSVVAPGAPANALQAANDLNQIILDDDSLTQNPDPIVYPSPELSATNTLRSGDTTSNIEGVLSYSRSGTDAYRIHATTAPAWEKANPRPTEPIPPSGGIRVAGLNVYNFFNGDGAGGGFPTSRGADTPEELIRQRDKLVAALQGLGADVIGLTEIENDGYGPTSAIQDLVDSLNEATTTYDFVTAPDLGTDAIKVALIYRTETITLTGTAVTTNTTPFDLYRYPLAQTFEERATGEYFTVVVNHFKSKGCSGASGLDADQGDGQSCYNYTRTQMAEVLADWLATDPTGSGDSGFLIIGDLNAYAMEDPIATLEAAGYTNLVGEDAYSYVYFGQAGYLDHALASRSMAGQVVDTSIWHINADEASVLDYNTEYKSAGQVVSLYTADEYRSSDHDPVIVDLELGGERVYLPVVMRGCPQP